MYILPPFRFTVYAIGIVLGYVLRMHKNTKLSKSQLNLGWFVTTTGVLGTLFITSLMSVYNYKFDILHAALFSSVAPIPWCFFFAWVIYTAQLGYKSEKNRPMKAIYASLLIDLFRQVRKHARMARVPNLHETLLRHLFGSVRGVPF